MRVGILTFHEVFNPGAFWQAYATCQVVRNLGHEPVVINYTNPAHRFRPLPGLLNLGAWRQPGYWIDCCRKDLSYGRSREKLLPISRRFLTRADLMTEYFDAVIIGADIVWDFRSPQLGKDPVYFGEFLNTPKLISWAASMGACDSAGEIPEFVSKGLPKFKAISVRDEKTADLVRKISGRVADVLPDPTFNLDITAIPRGKAPQKPYIAVYAIPGLITASFVSQARAFAAKNKLPLCAVGYRAKWADHNFVEAAPEDWFATFERAEYVMTNTFHGTVFSILLGKKFVTEYNPAIESKTQGMLDRLGLTQRILNRNEGNGAEQILLKDWPVGLVRDKIKTMAQEAQRFLSDALFAGTKFTDVSVKGL